MKIAIGSNVYEGTTAVDVCVEMEAVAAKYSASDSQMRQDYERSSHGALDACEFAESTAEHLGCIDARFARVDSIQSPPTEVWEFAYFEPALQALLDAYYEVLCQELLDVIVEVGWGQWL